MEGLPPRPRPPWSWGKRLGCLATLLVVGSFVLYTLASFDILPRRAYGWAHDRLRPGQSLTEAAAVLLELMESPGLFEIFQVTPGGDKRVLLARGQSAAERGSAEALAARIDRGQLVQVRMSTVNLSGLFTIALNSDGTVREVSRIDGYVK